MKLFFTLIGCLLLRPALAQWVNVGPGGEGLISISFADAQNGWACGVNAIFYRTQDGGATWQSIPNFYNYKPRNNMLAVAATAPDRVALLWQLPSTTTPAVLYYSLNTNNTTYYNSATNGFGDYTNLNFRQSGLGLVVGNSGALAISRDTGLSWRNLTSGTQNDLVAVDSPDGNVAYVVGSNGTLRRSFGPEFTTWQALNSTTTTRLTNVWFVDTLQGYVVGENGTALRTIDGGITWKPMPVNTQADLNAIRFLNASLGFIAGDVGTLLLTRDGGNSWQAEASGTYETLSSISAAADGSAIWVAGGGGTVLKRGPVIALAGRHADVVSAWQAYPNPFTTSILVSGVSAVKAHVRLLDATGRLIMDKQLDGSSNQDACSLATPSDLPAGVYFLQLDLPQKSTFTQRLVHLP